MTRDAAGSPPTAVLQRLDERFEEFQQHLCGLVRIRALPFDEAAFRRSAGVLEGVALGGEPAYPVYERLWRRPSLSVIAFEAQPLQGAANKIVDAARARLSLRTPAGIDAREAGQLLIAELSRDVPNAARVEARVVTSAPAWRTDPEGPAFDAARRALAAGYGREAAVIGVGGSIGFVEPISRFLRGAPCLLTGVEDPERVRSGIPSAARPPLGRGFRRGAGADWRRERPPPGAVRGPPVRLR